jgi:H/ACA ribonucleoprotein complex subunit 3
MKPKLLRICRSCYRYTMEERCPVCSKPTEVSHPPKFSPDDKYLKLRIEAKLKNSYSTSS